MPYLLYLWREERDGGPAAADIPRQLDGGEDVDTLADLPIKDMIARLKADFSGCKEVAGAMLWKSEEERWQATWSWQFLRLECFDLQDEQRDKLLEIAREFGCSVYDPQLNLKM